MQNQRAFKQQYDYKLKVVVVGNQSVGKSSIVSSCEDRNFGFQMKLTVGFEFVTKDMNINGKNVQVQFWDTSGQDQFQALTRSCYRGADAIIIVYDVTDLYSFKCVESYFYDDILNNADSEVQIMVLANKLDLSYNREVQYKDGYDFCEQKKFIFKEVSAKQPQLVEDALDYLLKNLLPTIETQQQKTDKLTFKLNKRQNQNQNPNLITKRSCC